MKENKYTYIESLLNKFFEGETSKDEERELYLFFSEGDVPVDLINYKPIFNYFDKDIFEDSKQSGIRKKIIKYKWILYSGIAAIFLIIGVSLYVFKPQQEEFNPYEGSYIVRNGVKITDIDIIKPEIETIMFTNKARQKNMNEKVKDLENNKIDLEKLKENIIQKNVEILNVKASIEQKIEKANINNN